MLYQGQFRDLRDNMITVYIDVNDGSTETVTIGEEDSDILFDVDPVTIDLSADSTFDAIYMKTMSLTVITKHYLGHNLFTGDPRSVRVNIFKTDRDDYETANGITRCIFAGFVDSNIYSQDYNAKWDKLTLNCSDILCTLQYYNYGNLANESDFNARKKMYGEVTFSQIISECINSVCRNIDLHDGAISNIYYDGSVVLSKETLTNKDIFSQIKISDLLFLGETYDDIMTQEEVLTEILNFLDLKIRQEGLDFYIYCPQTIYQLKNPINWYPILTLTDLVEPDNNMDLWILQPDQFKTVEYSDGDVTKVLYYQLLTNSKTGNEKTGELLLCELSTDTDQIKQDDTVLYVNYYNLILPSGTRYKLSDGNDSRYRYVINGEVKEHTYELTTSDDIIVKTDDTYYIADSKQGVFKYTDTSSNCVSDNNYYNLTDDVYVVDISNQSDDSDTSTAVIL